MEIVVYDDDAQFVALIEAAIEDLNKKYDGVFGLPKCFGDMKDVLEYAEANVDKPIVFLLDIVTDGVQTGFDIAKRIKQFSPDNLIIYITDFKEKILSNMVHKMLSFGFILKESERFYDELEEGLSNARDLFMGQYFVNDGYKSMVRLRFRDIYYFEKKKQTQYIIIVHKDGYSTIKENLVRLKKKLNSDFCYSTKEYIVNTQAITRVDKIEKKLYFENGVVCPYSRTRKKELFGCLLELQCLTPLLSH